MRSATVFPLLPIGLKLRAVAATPVIPPTDEAARPLQLGSEENSLSDCGARATPLPAARR